MPTATWRLACVSRLSTEKGVDDLLRAIAHRRGGTERTISLQICGDGDERAALEALATELGISCRRRLPGAP